MRRLALPLLPLVAIGCAAPDVGDLFHGVDVVSYQTQVDIDERYIDFFDSATETLYVALPAIADPMLADALIAAYDAGVDVRVVTDIDRAPNTDAGTPGDPGVVALLDAEVPLRLADGDMAYFDFALGEDVAWTSEEVIMSHSIALADGERALSATTAGGTGDGDRIVLDLRGEDLMSDLFIEFNQVFGGSDATATTSYDSAAKSIADFRWIYPTETDVQMEMWLGPQERLTKRIIDAVYSAKSDVRVLTNDFANDGLAKALQTKASYGFEATAIVGPNFGTTSYFTSQVLADSTPAVAKFEVDDEVVPTIVLIDYQVASDGRRHGAKAFVLSHDLYSAARLFRGDEVLNDQLIDGNLFVFNDWDEPSAAMLDIERIFQDHLDRAEDLTWPRP